MEENMNTVQEMQREMVKEETPRGGKFGVVRTGTFYGLGVLFAIPVIGLIAAVLFAFLHKNKNIKHFAGAAIIRSVVSLVLIVILVFTGIWAINTLLPGVSEYGGIVQTVGTVREVKNTMDKFEQAGGNVEKLVEVYDQTGNIDDVIKEVEDKGVDPKPLIDKLGGKEKAAEAIEEFKKTGNLPGGISTDMIQQYMK